MNKLHWGLLNTVTDMDERVVSDGKSGRLSASAAMALASQMAALDVQDLPLTPSSEGPSPNGGQLFSPDSTAGPEKKTSFLRVVACHIAHVLGSRRTTAHHRKLICRPAPRPWTSCEGWCSRGWKKGVEKHFGNLELVCDCNASVPGTNSMYSTPWK